jgi:hypothetical protein
MAINTASKKGTSKGPAIFSPETTITKAALTNKNLDMDEDLSIMLLLPILWHYLTV